MIWQELDKDLVFTDLEAKDYKEVMEKLGGRFVELGYCKDTYVDALKKRESEFPTGLDIEGFGVAMPHTDISHVIKHGIAIAHLSEPVDFIQMGTDDEIAKVKLVFMLAVDDPNAHLDKIQDILKIIQDKEVLVKLSETKDADEMIKIIKEKENY